MESACIGVPHDKTGEAAKVFVVKRDPALTEQVLIEHCRKNLSALQSASSYSVHDGTG
jgi:long-chain acyl-CoA synthetase